MMNWMKLRQTACHVLPLGLVLVYLAFPISNALANLAMLLACALWLASGQWHDKWHRIRGNPGLWMALALYGWMWLGIVYTDASNDEIRQHLIKYFKLAFMAVVVSSLANDTWRRRCWTAFAVAMLFTLSSTYLNIWFQLPWSATANQGWNTDHTVFKDYISQGILMSMFVGLCLAQLLRSSLASPYKGMWAVLAVLSVLSMTHLSAGRSGYLALAAALLGFAWWALSGWKRWGAMLLLALGTLGVYTSSPMMQVRIDQAIQEARHHNPDDFSSIGQRIYFANKSLALIADKPLLGWGTGAYHQQFCRVADNEQWCEHGKFHPHNQFLFIWVEHGALGLLLLVGMIVMPVWMTRRAPSHVRGLAAAYSAIFVVISMTHGSLWLSTESHFHTLMGALLMAGYRQPGTLPGRDKEA